MEADASWSSEICSNDVGLLAPDVRATSLRRTIEAEIIPRLMLAHALPSNDALALADIQPHVGEGEVALLTEMVLRRDAAAGQAYVCARCAAGLPIETLYLQLLAPVALRLGEMWEADLCDFTQVTVGLWRLQQIVFDHSFEFQRDRRLRMHVRRVMLAPAPGSQHTFGVVMVGEFFRRAGWDARGDPGANMTEVSALLADEWYDVVGLSMGSACHEAAVASAILGFRKSSLNPAIAVMVGGPVVDLTSDFVRRVGADGTAPDAAAAVVEAEKLVDLRASTA
ncbi:MAG TPA: cobalamin B12-binding domain-containing protein [Burkholderiaceae bacterium]|nr:cobalamin B12-binding domain-containing protein [Burkholderiaceae bacterium]